MTIEDGSADRMNSLPKYVASRTLQDGDWNAAILPKDYLASISQLREESGQNLLMYGSADFRHTLMAQDLVDEYRLWVHPVVVHLAPSSPSYTSSPGRPAAPAVFRRSSHMAAFYIRRG
jgi:dihydrofolate reductase